MLLEWRYWLLRLFVRFGNDYVRSIYNNGAGSNCTSSDRACKWWINLTGYGVLGRWISRHVSILGSIADLCRYNNGTSGNGTCGDDSNHSCTSNGSSNNVRDRSGKFGGNVGIQRWGRYCFFVL
jgi:hypothetical protein